MGRPTSNEPIIQHFSHPHPLQLSSPLDHHHRQQQSLAPPLSCANCRLPAHSPAGGCVYACSPCGYVLHVQCSQMPPLIHHASHRAHPLSLLPAPAYPDGSFHCNACAKPGTGFSYHCHACGGGVDLHTLCASLPLSNPNPDLHAHPLALTFAPPYENYMGFSCDVCGGTGSPGQWLYRCAPCEFDAHLECGGRQPTVGQIMRRSASVGGGGGGGGGRGLGRVGIGRGGWMVRQMVQGLVSSATQRIGTRFVPGYVGGDGGSTAGEVNGSGGSNYSSGAWNGMNHAGTGGDGYCDWNANGGGGGGGGGGPSGAWNGYGGNDRGGQGPGGGPGTGNDPNGGGGGPSGAWNGYGGTRGGGQGCGGGPDTGNYPNGGPGPSGAWNGYGGTGSGGQGRGGGPGTGNDPNDGAQASNDRGGNGYGSGGRNGCDVGRDNGEGSGSSRNSSVDGGGGGVGYDHLVGYLLAAKGRRAAIDLI